MKYAECTEYILTENPIAMQKIIALSQNEKESNSQELNITKGEIAENFSEAMGIMAAILYAGDGQTQANTGVELRAVVKETENAANRILDAADRINSLIGNIKFLESESERNEFAEIIRGDVQEILLSCTFQDITGQRIMKALENISLVESKMKEIIAALGIADLMNCNIYDQMDKMGQQNLVTSDSDGNEGDFGISSQDDIDKLFD